MTTRQPPRHLSDEEFRRAGYAVIDWLIDYRARVADLPVMPRVTPGDIRATLPAAAPAHGESFDDILADLVPLIEPGLMHWQSPRFFGYFPANASPPSILAELLGAGLGQQGMLWQTSPATTELESHVLDWLVDMLDLPARFRSDGAGGGVIQDSASSATLCALLAARERACQWRARESGNDPALVAYCSRDTHSSLDKAMSIAGLGRTRLRKIATDEAQRLDVDALARAMDDDVAAGLRPFFVCATVGTTSALAIDPVAATGAVAAAHGAWLHVDAAMAGSAAVCPEFRFVNEGLARADSYCFNPHKWLLTNFDCDCFYVADREPLLRALAVMPEYLRNAASESGTAVDYRDWQIPLGRRFRALKLWFVIRSYGLEGLRAFVRHHVDLACELEALIAADAAFELRAPRTLNLLCFASRKGDALSRAVLERVNAGGRAFLSHTLIDGRYCLRLCIGQTYTTREHVLGAWQELRAAHAALSGEGT